MPPASPPAAFTVGRYVSWLIVALMGASAAFAIAIGYLNWRDIGV